MTDTPRPADAPEILRLRIAMNWPSEGVTVLTTDLRYALARLDDSCKGCAFTAEIVRQGQVIDRLYAMVDDGSYDMTLHNWFAGQAAQGSAERVCDFLDEDDTEGARAEARRHAIAAGMIADAMLAERDKANS